ncbi:MAG: DJ-1/PfpI family protein [bacterium]|nr:DJ-1/PfpI family protein [bacterium]
MVYVFFADGFEEVEAIEPIDIMRRAGIEVLTVSLGDAPVTGAHNICVKADIVIDEVNKDDIEAIVLPGGGRGHENLDASNSVHALISYAVANGRYVCAICAAPSILGRRQLLDGKKATCFPGFEKYLYGADYVTDKVVKDGRFITARGAGAAAEFGFEITAALKGRETAEAVKAQMQF